MEFIHNKTYGNVVLNEFYRLVELLESEHQRIELVSTIQDS
jgi:hypothetical protein